MAGKLAQDIMGAAVDGALPVVGFQSTAISEETRLKAESILRDAFVIMRNPRLRIGGETATVRDGDEDLVDVNTNDGAAGELRAAKSKLLKNMSRKHLVENVVPVVVSLKVRRGMCVHFLDCRLFLLFTNMNIKFLLIAYPGERTITTSTRPHDLFEVIYIARLMPPLSTSPTSELMKSNNFSEI